MAVSTWITVLECDARGLTHECILALGDNTSALGWIHRCALEEGSIYYNAAQMTARQIARLLSDSSHCLASQHLKGATNDVPDFLSFEGHLRQDKPPHPLAPDCPSDAELTRRFHSFLPQVIPENFEISPLPNEVLSFVMRVLQTAESSWTRNKKSLTSTRTGSGDDGAGSATRPESVITPSSLVYPMTSGNSSFEPSSASTETLLGISQAELLEGVRAPWSLRRSELPQAIWLRRFGNITNGAPSTSRTAKSSARP